MSVLLRELVPTVERKLGQILDSAGDGQNWQALAVEMGYNSQKIRCLELNLQRGVSPARELLRDFGAKNYTTDVVWRLLAKIGQQTGMETIRDFVSPHLTQRDCLSGDYQTPDSGVERDSHLKTLEAGYPRPPSPPACTPTVKQETWITQDSFSVSETSADSSTSSSGPHPPYREIWPTVRPTHYLHRPPSDFTSAMLREFSYEELSIATDGFSEEPSVARNGRNCGKVGEGGYGNVYKGVLRQRIPVAVKRLIKPDSSNAYFESLAQLDSSIFSQEVAKMSRIRHPHIVSLLGYNEPHQLVVYEWMANGSLAECLAMKCKQGGLTCLKRVRIAHDIAKALLYIHTFPGCPMLHLNVKSCNILLGESFTAKLGDFGIAMRPRGKGETSSRAQLNTKSRYMAITGTYLPPEYIRGKISAALDVYAFGVVLLEIMTGQKTYDPRRETHDLTSYMNDSLDAIDDDQSLVLACRDPRCSNWPDEDFVRFGRLARRCLGDRLKRPSSENIARDLERLYAFIQRVEGNV